MSSWIDLPRFRATINSRQFEVLVRNVAEHDDIPDGFIERSLGMQHISCVGPAAGAIAQPLAHELRSLDVSVLFGEAGPPGALDRLLRRVDRLIGQLRSNPGLATAEADDLVTVTGPGGSETIAGSSLAIAAGLAPAAELPTLRSDYDLNAHASALSDALADAFNRPHDFQLTWSTDFDELGDIVELESLLSVLDPEAAPRHWLVVDERWSCWAYPVLGSTSDPPRHASEQLDDRVWLVPSPDASAHT